MKDRIEALEKAINDLRTLVDLLINQQKSLSLSVSGHQLVVEVSALTPYYRCLKCDTIFMGFYHDELNNLIQCKENVKK